MDESTPLRLSDFEPGDTVRLGPASDWWMRGVVYARVTVVGRTWLTIEWYGRKLRIRPRDVVSVQKRGGS